METIPFFLISYFIIFAINRELPPSIGNLKQLRELRLASNKLTVIPMDLLLLGPRALRRFDISGNPLAPPPKSLPDTVGDTMDSVPTLFEVRTHKG